MQVDYEELRKASNIKKLYCIACKNGDIKINCNICSNPICSLCIYGENYCIFCFNNNKNTFRINQELIKKYKKRSCMNCFGYNNKKIIPL